MDDAGAPSRTIDSFVAEFSASGGSERANAQLFVIGLCEVLGLPRPDAAREDTAHDDYVFERKIAFRHPNGTTTPGWIDCYKRDAFILEAKQSRKRTTKGNPDQLALPGEAFLPKTGHAIQGTRQWDRVMVQARKQAEDYARALPVDHGYPPFLLIVDVGHVIEVFADFSGQGKNYSHFPDRQSYRITMDDLRDPAVQDRLRTIWEDPQSLDPARRSAAITRDIADRLAIIARRLEKRHDPKTVAEFLMRCIFTMFAEDVGLLPRDSFKDLLADMRTKPQDFVPAMESLWRDMDEGGYAGAIRATVRRFNGSLFKDRTALPLDPDELNELCIAAGRDWQDVEPAIFGTLLERALDPRERSQLGAHYTPRAYVERLVVPTIIEPLRSDWDAVQGAVRDLKDKGQDREALNRVRAFHRQLCTTRVLDPACGTGNFLYVALELMKRLEGEVLEAIADLGGQPDRYSDFPDEAGAHRVGRKLAAGGGRFSVDPHQFHGLELNPRAVPIADLVLWLGFIKWQIRTGVDLTDPVLDAYGTIRQQDAILAHDGERPALDEHGQPRHRWDGITRRKHPVTGEDVPDPAATVPITEFINPRRAPWPEAEFIIGNPPFIGGKDMRAELGDGYAEAAWKARPDIPGGADFVMHFWDEAARRLAAKGTKARPNPTRRFGFITTNSITQTFSRRVMEQRPKGEPPLSLVFAVPDHPWLKSADRAAVRIAMTVAQRGAAEGVLGKVAHESGLNTDAPDVRLDRRRGKITSKLTIGADFAQLKPLWANQLIAFKGYMPWGRGFIVDAEATCAKELRLKEPERLLTYFNGRDIVQRPRHALALDMFGLTESEVQRSFPETYSHLLENVKPERDSVKRAAYVERWWVFAEPRQGMREALSELDFFLATAETAKHRIFQVLPKGAGPDQKVRVVAISSFAAISILSSRAHVLPSIVLGGRQGVGNDLVYNNSRAFLPFPFPDLSDAAAATLADLGERLDAFRKDRLAAHDHLTMTGLYNALERLRELDAGAPVDPLSDAERDTHAAGQISILKDLHDRIDRAVLDAYGWSDLAPALVGRPGGTVPSRHKTPEQDAAEEELMMRLVALNRDRAAQEARGDIRWLRPAFQVPKLRHKAPQPARSEQMEADIGLVAAVAEPIPWPKDGLDQIRAVRGVLAEADAPVLATELNAQFKGGRKRGERLADLLTLMAETGMVRRDASAGQPRYFVPD